MEWTPDSTGLLYTDLDDAGRPARVMRHRLGTAADQDEEVFREPDPAAYLDISRTKVGHRHFYRRRNVCCGTQKVESIASGRR